MGDGNRRGRIRPHNDDEFPDRLRAWLVENDGLVAGLVRLRELPKAERAVMAVSAVPEVKRAKLSWALWEALVSGHGDEPERLLLGRIPLADLANARLAFWGLEGSFSTGHLRLVED